MIDLHVHLDGSLSAENLIYLADKYGVKIKGKKPEDLKKYIVANNPKSLKDYLECFDLPIKVLQTPKAIEEAVFLVLSDLKRKGLKYVELRFAPVLHTSKSTQDEIVSAAITGLYKSCMKANLILCMMRNASLEDNLKTIEVAYKNLGNGVVGIDLAGDEAKYKTESFKELFDKANELSIPITIHAGEADDKTSILSAINFNCKRIGHGVKADEECLKIIKKKGIFLEMCPTSNIQTKASTIEEYPLKKFLEYGIKVTINTDNLTVSNTSIFKEYDFIKQQFGITDEMITVLLNNACDAAFIPDDVKKELKEEIKNIRL